jgi:ATP-dependent protease ClpP protease subunit
VKSYPTILRTARRQAAVPTTTPRDSVYERLLDQRIVVLGQQVDDEIANRIVAQLLLLSAEDLVHRPGGLGLWLR